MKYFLKVGKVLGFISLFSITTGFFKKNLEEIPYVKFTLNGTKFKFPEPYITNLVFDFNKAKFTQDTTKTLIIMFAAISETKPLALIQFGILENSEPLHADFDYSSKFVFMFHYCGTNSSQFDRASYSQQNFKFVFSTITSTHFKGTFSGNIGTGTDSTITDGTFNVYNNTNDN